MDDCEGLVSPVAETVPVNPIPVNSMQAQVDEAAVSQQFFCRICHTVCMGDGANDAFQITLPELQPLSALTAHGKFTAAIIHAGFIGKTICIHGSSMLVLNDPETLYFLISRISDQDQKCLDWAKQVVTKANVFLGIQ